MIFCPFQFFFSQPTVSQVTVDTGEVSRGRVCGCWRYWQVTRNMQHATPPCSMSKIAHVQFIFRLPNLRSTLVNFGEGPFGQSKITIFGGILYGLKLLLWVIILVFGGVLSGGMTAILNWSHFIQNMLDNPKFWQTITIWTCKKNYNPWMYLWKVKSNIQHL